MNFHVISHCEIHRVHQENQRYSFHAELGGQGDRNPGSSVQPLSFKTDTGKPEKSDRIRTEITDQVQTPDSLLPVLHFRTVHFNT